MGYVLFSFLSYLLSLDFERYLKQHYLNKRNLRLNASVMTDLIYEADTGGSIIRYI